uniref:Uncharacterized protein n=1 Tax=Plectus sambesii TaxID=2011161 RepID=A0A914WGX4_9BILA
MQLVDVLAVLLLGATAVRSFPFQSSRSHANNDLEPNFLRLRRTSKEQEPLCMAPVIRAYCDRRGEPDNDDQLKCRMKHCESCLNAEEGILFEVDAAAPYCRRLTSCACYLNDSDQPQLRTEERRQCRALMREISVLVRGKSVASSVKDELWLPDLYFANAKSAQFHTVTVPNFNMFIDQDGTVAYSTRVTLNVACNLNLMNYPLDHQLCLIKIISYAYIMTEMNVTWFSRDPIRYNPEIGLPEFAITDISHGYCDGTFDYTITEQKHRRAPFSCLLGNIRLKRSIGYHLVQSYIPTGLIVVISWVSFWIDRRAVPARVSLSFTTLLTMSTLGNGLRYALPPVSYAKAIDYWFGACMMFVFGALLEFAIVNSYMRRANKFDYLAQNMKWSKRYSGRGHDDMGDSPIPTLMTEVFSCPTTPEKKHFKQVKRELGRLGYDHLIHQAFRYSRKALMVDKRCRVVFPLAFITFNSLYWGYYLWMVEKYL